MGLIRSFLQWAQIAQDDTSGALLVKLDGDVTIEHMDADVAPLGNITDPAAEGDAASGTLIASVRGLAKNIGTTTAGWLADVLAALKAAAGSDVTIISVPIDQSGGAGSVALLAASGSKITRLHGIMGTLDADGTLSFTDGTAVLIGPMPLAKNSGPMDRLGDKALAWCATPASANKPLTLVTTGGGFHGVALVSQT